MIPTDATPDLKEPARRRIDRDTQRFLSQGGSIEEVDPGVSGEDWDMEVKILRRMINYATIHRERIE